MGVFKIIHNNLEIMFQKERPSSSVLTFILIYKKNKLLDFLISLAWTSLILKIAHFITAIVQRLLVCFNCM